MLCVLWSLASNGLLGGASFRLARGLCPGTCVPGAGGEVPLCSLLLPPGPPRAVCPRVYDHASPSHRQGTPRCALRADGSAFLGRAGPVEPGGDGNEKEMRLWLFPLGIPRMRPCSPSTQRPGFLLFLPSSFLFPPGSLPLLSGHVRKRQRWALPLHFFSFHCWPGQGEFCLTVWRLVVPSTRFPKLISSPLSASIKPLCLRSP